MLDAKAELETKVRMLALPIDICARHVTVARTVRDGAFPRSLKDPAGPAWACWLWASGDMCASMHNTVQLVAIPCLLRTYACA